MAKPWEQYGATSSADKKPWEQYAEPLNPRLISSYDTEPVAEENGLWREAGDTALSVGKGALGATKALSDVFGAENVVSRGLKRGIGVMDELQSDEQKQQRQMHAQRMAEAEATGSKWEEAKAAGRNFLDDPIDYSAEGVGSFVPYVPLGLIGAGAKVAGVGGRLAATVGMGAAQGTGAVKGSQYDAVYNELRKEGATHEDADARAMEHQGYNGDNAVNLLTGAALGAAASLGVERVVSRAGMSSLAGKGLVKRTAAGTAYEVVPEAIQGGQERYAANDALDQEGFEVDPWRGVTGAATQEGLMAGPAGGAVAAAQGYVKTPGEIEADAIQQETYRVEQERTLAEAQVQADEQAQVEAQAQQEAARVQAHRQQAAQLLPYPEFEAQFKESEKARKGEEKALVEEAKMRFGQELVNNPEADQKQYIADFLAERGVTQGEKRDVRAAYIQALDNTDMGTDLLGDPNELNPAPVAEDVAAPPTDVMADPQQPALFDEAELPVPAPVAVAAVAPAKAAKPPKPAKPPSVKQIVRTEVDQAFSNGLISEDSHADIVNGMEGSSKKPAQLANMVRKELAAAKKELVERAALPVAPEVPARDAAPDEVQAYRVALKNHLLAALTQQENTALAQTRNADLTPEKTAEEILQLRTRLMNGRLQQQGRTEPTAADNKLVDAQVLAATAPRDTEGDAPASLRTAADEMGVSHTQVANIRNAALAKLETLANAAGVSMDVAKQVLGIEAAAALDVTPISEAQAAQAGLAYRKNGSARSNVAESDDFDATAGYENNDATVINEAADDAGDFKRATAGEAASTEDTLDAGVDYELPEATAVNWRDHTGAPIQQVDIADAAADYNGDLTEGDATFEQLAESDQARYVKAYIAAADKVISAQQLMRIFGEIADGNTQADAVAERAAEEKPAVEEVQAGLPQRDAQENAGEETEADAGSQAGQTVNFKELDTRVAELRKNVGEVQGKRLEKLLERYASDEIDAQRLGDELQMLEEQAFPPEQGGKGVMFSKADEAVDTTEGQDANALRAKMRKLFVNPALFDRRVTVVQNEADVPAHLADKQSSKGGTTRQAFYVTSTGHVYLIADAIPAGRELAVFLHEVGGHMGMRSLLGKANFDRLYEQINTWAEGSGAPENTIAQAALARTLNAGVTSEAEVKEEMIAYFIEEAVAAGIDPTALGKIPKGMLAWFNALWNAVKSAVQKLGINPATLTAQDVVDLAYGAARLELNGSQTDIDAAATAAGRPASDVLFVEPGQPQVRNSVAPTAKSIEDKIYAWNAPESVKNAAFVTVSNLKTYGKKAAYYMAFGHDLADMVAGILPSAKTYFNIADAKESVKIHHEAMVDRIVSKAYNVTDKAALNRFLETSTKQAKWGFQPAWMPGTVVEIDAAAATQFAALTPEAQASAKEIFKHGFESRNELRKLVRAEIEDGFNSENKTASAEEKKSIERRRMKAMRMFDKDLPMMQTPYAPLSRFGNYVMVAKSQLWLDAEANNDQKFLDENRSSGQHYVVSFHDYPGQAALAARQMAAAGWPSADHSPKEVFAQGVTEAPWNAMRRLRTLVDQEYGGTTPGDRKAAESARKHINQMLSDLYLATLSETSARKHNLKRANVEGSSDDMLRAFASKGKADAHFIAALAKNGEITDALAAMRKQASERGATRDDRKLALNEILSRHALGLAYQETPIQDRLMQFNSVWTLLTKPSYYFQNATQPWMMSLPVIARHKDVGMRKAASALTEAYSQLAPAFGKDGIVKGMLKGEFDIDALPVAPDEKKMLNALRDLGILDVGINRDMGYWESRGGMSAPLVDALHKMNGWVKQVETVNRVTTALAAYRVVGGGQKGIDEATHVIRTTHGNYSGSNAPRLWSIPGARTILQFRKFQFIQASLMIRLFANTKFGSREEKAAAWAALGWTFGHFAVMTGATGLPAMALIGTMLAAAGGDDDEPVDFDKMAREAIGDKTLADLILKGAPSLIGLDMTGMLGAQNMLSILPYTDVDMNDRTGYAKTMIGLSGSFWGGTMSNMADGVGLIQQGDLYKGFEKMLPSGLSKAANAWRMASDGYTNRNGDLLMDSDELTGLVALAQGMGLRTTRVADMQAATGRTIEFDRFYRERASEITHRYVKAYRSGDAGELTKQRQAYMDLQASKRANGFKAQPLSNLLKAPRDQMKRERNTVGGVQFNRNNREFVEDAVAEN